MTKTVIPPAMSVSDSRGGGLPTIGSPVAKRSIIRNGHKSSVSLEDQFWDALREIAGRENITVSALVATIDHGSNRDNLSSAIRVFVLDQFMRNSEHKLPVGQSNRDSPAARATPR